MIKPGFITACIYNYDEPYKCRNRARVFLKVANGSGYRAGNCVRDFWCDR